MKRNLIPIIIFLLIANFTFAQKLSQLNVETLSYNTPNQQIDETQKRGIPSSIMIWNTEDLQQIDDAYIIKLKSSTGFTCFGVGWSTSDKDLNPMDFAITYKIVKNPDYLTSADKNWGIFEEEEGYLKPSDTGTDFYWSDLLFGYDEQSRQELFITLTPPKGVKIEQIRIDFMNLSNDINPDHAKNMMPTYDTKSCPAQPSLISRDDWCGSYTACSGATYTPTAITPTHVVIHHGASPDTYTDGYAVVRSYWNYHVNTLGWSDIGYNYLIDKYGNLFQGRKNANAPLSDVRGAHAGASNPYSIGINFLGNADVTLPTTAQLNKLYDFLGWWFDYKGLDPTSSANIVLQSGGTENKPRICGHKDVNVGGTSCPGTTLYSMLATIRTNVQAVINDCNDSQNPTTSIVSPGTWVSGNFNVSFTDADNIGVSQRFYQVLDYNGSEWRANNSFGFFNDNFASEIHSDWTSVSGTWAIASGLLKIADESKSNTNIYAPVTQASGNSYMYHFKMKISGSGTNKRAGVHFMCDDASQTNRNNSYMVYFRADGNKVQIYEYTSNTMSLKTDDDCTITAGTAYDIKIIYNSSTGKIDVFQNNDLVSTWTDTTPLTTGNHVSLRSGNCIAEYDDFKVYKSRSTSAAVTVGNSSAKEIRYQSASSTSYAGKILSVVVDAANNVSSVATLNQKVDFWGPYAVSTVNDGISSDIDTQTGTTSISGNWTSTSDINNTISNYWYAVGSTSGASDIVSWTNNGTSLSFTKSGLSLSVGSTYYITVKAQNAAGLYSSGKTSDGVTIYNPVTYCTSQGNNVSDEWLNKVVFGSISNLSGANGGYADFTSYSTSVNKGSSYAITLYPDWSGTIYSEYYKVWIDFNQDGDFDDSGEEVLSQSGTKNTVISGTITIPSTASTGSTRMRVTLKYGSYPSACEAFTWGEVEDYTVIIGAKSEIVNESELAQNENIINFSVYPNPAKDNLNIDLSAFENEVQVQIYSITGALVNKFNSSNTIEPFDISSLNAGVYTIVVISEGKVLNQKFIKQ